MGISMSPKFLFIFHKFDVYRVGITRVEFLQPASKGYLGATGVKESHPI